MSMKSSLASALIGAALIGDITQEDFPYRRRVQAKKLGDVNFLSLDHSHSPKEYGEYLQRTGKQKWSKSKRRKN